MKEKITYLCDSCNTDIGVKIRTKDGVEEGMYCRGCWNAIKDDIGKVFICDDCGSNKARKRYISTGVGKNDYLHGVLCDDCFLKMFYEYSN
jgi:uncharacterized protein YlaI